MGEGVGASIRGQGFDVITVLAGRSEGTRARALRAGLREVPDLGALVSEADLVLSILPPERALPLARDVARAMADTGSAPPFADLNAVSPATAREIAGIVGGAGAPYIDGGIVGLAPFKGDSPTRIYVSGAGAALMDALDGNGKTVIGLGDEVGRASAVKMVYASVTKGTDTLLTAAYMASERLGVRDVLEEEWAASQPAVLERMKRRIPALPADSGRWIGEMEEIAATYAGCAVTPRFHEGAAEVYRVLAATPFAAETRETMDRGRTMQQSVEVYVAHLPES